MFTARIAAAAPTFSVGAPQPRAAKAAAALSDKIRNMNDAPTREAKRYKIIDVDKIRAVFPGPLPTEPYVEVPLKKEVAAFVQRELQLDMEWFMKDLGYEDVVVRVTQPTAQ